MEINRSSIKRITEGIVQTHDLPGIGLGIVSPQNILFMEGFRYSEIETKTKHTEHTIQRIGSITKTMTAISAMSLVEQGRLDMDAKVTDLVPSITFNTNFSPIRVRHLLTHTSGIGEMPEIKDYSSPDLKLWGTSGQFDIPNHYPNGIDVDFEPGTDWHYANHGWGILGEIIARIENDTWQNVIQKTIFDRLGMKNSYAYDEPVAGMSVGYQRDPTQDDLDRMELIGHELIYGDRVDGINIRSRKYDYVGPAAAGSVMCSLEDMCIYTKSLLNKTAGIISDKTFDAMLQVQYAPDPKLNIKMGLGFQIKSMFGHYAYGHNGSISGGWNSVMILLPSLEIGVIIHLNLTSDLVDEITDEIVYEIVGRPLVKNIKKPITLEQQSKICGVYRHRPGFVARCRPIKSWGRIQIIKEGDDVYIQSRRGEWRDRKILYKSDLGEHVYIVDDGKMNATLISADGNTLTVDRLSSLDKDKRAKSW